MRITDDRGLVPAAALTLASAPTADATLYALDASGTVRARCGLWWKAEMHHQGRRVGRIGAYAAYDEAAAALLLDAARQRLRGEGCAIAVGPMDGSTWDRYRFALGGGAAPFVLEPHQPADYVAHWQRAGFQVAATYRSTEGAIQPVAPSPLAPGLDVRPLDLGRLDAELAALHGLSLRAFAQAPFFAPIGGEAFAARYRALLPHVDSDLVLMVEAGSRLVAAAFALPDGLERPVETVVLKTLAVDPDWFGRGLGRWLAGEIEQRADARGYRRVVHALMHEANPSTRLRADHRLRRRYALFSTRLS